jgi:hypothetical protein
MELNTTKLKQAGFRKTVSHDNCVVLDIGSGTFPRYIEVRPPGDDGSRMTALWDGSLDLAVNDKVIADEYSGNPIWRIVSKGGNDSGAGSVRVSKVWESDFGAVALQADATGQIEVGKTTGPDAKFEVLDTAGAQLRLTFEDGVKFSDFTVDTSHNLTIDPSSTGKILLNSTVKIIDKIEHQGDIDTNISFTDDKIAFDSGAINLLALTEDTQNLVEIGDVAGGGDVDVNINNGDMFIEGSSGAVGVNNTSITFTVEGTTVTPQFIVDRDDVGAKRGAVFAAASSSAGRNAQNQFLRARGSLASPTAVQSADQLGDFFWGGHDGTDYNTVARFGAIVDGAVSANTVPTGIRFSTSATNSGGLAERMRIQSDNNVKIGPQATTALAQLHVDQSSTSAAEPVLYLDQADVSEEMIQFETTIGVGNAIEAVGAKTLTTTHFIKVTLPGSLTRYIPVGTIA